MTSGSLIKEVRRAIKMPWVFLQGAHKPVELSRRLVSALEKYPQHVDGDTYNHKCSRPSVEVPEKPAERHHVAQILDVCPRPIHTGDVIHHQEGPGKDAQQEKEYTKPTKTKCISNKP